MSNLNLYLIHIKIMKDFVHVRFEMPIKMSLAEWFTIIDLKIRCTQHTCNTKMYRAICFISKCYKNQLLLINCKPSFYLFCLYKIMKRKMSRMQFIIFFYITVVTVTSIFPVTSLGAFFVVLLYKRS